jgi:hypothetical protein
MSSASCSVIGRSVACLKAGGERASNIDARLLTLPSSSSLKAHSSPSTGASGGVSLKLVKGENFCRNAKDARRLKLLTGGKPIRDKQGVIIQAAE